MLLNSAVSRFSFSLVLISACIVGSTTVDAEQEPTKARKKSLAECIQPDYAKWIDLKIGTSEADVKKVLGKPLEETETPKEFAKDPQFAKLLTYGRIRFEDPSTPDPFEFYIVVAEGKVIEKVDPFGGALSSTGKPTTPTLILPQDRAVFDHFPRFVDARWNPSSGKYPIEYAVEVEIGNWVERSDENRNGISYRSAEKLKSDSPYCVFSLGGANPGRWRVKAKNSLGESPWSDWRYFRFER